MSAPENTAPVPTSRCADTFLARTGMFRVVQGIGAAGVVASALLIIGAFTTDPSAGESWQPAGVLGLIGLCFGVTFLLVGMPARSTAPKAERR